MEAGYYAQLKSIVLLKNSKRILPLGKDTRVYIPKRHFSPRQAMFGSVGNTAGRVDYPVSLDIVRKYANVTEDPSEAELALVFIDSPSGGNGYSTEDAGAGGN